MILPLYSFKGGENSNISPLIHPVDNPVILNGCNNTWKIGVLTKDTGYAALASGSIHTKPILGLYDFVQAPGTEKALVTIDNATSANTELWYVNNIGVWTQISTTAWNSYHGQVTSMAGFIGYNFFVGADSSGNFLPVASLTGTTFSTSTNVTNMAQGNYVVPYRSRLYVGNAKISSTRYPGRVYFSSVPQSGAITWDRTNDFFDADLSYEITGMTSIWDRLVVFTDYKTYIYDQSSCKDTWSLGCSNHKTIKQSAAYLMWANSDGVWISTGGQPQNISGEISDFIHAANPRNMYAEIVDEEYWLYLGNVTVDGIDYTNCVKVFNIPMSAWRTREFYNNMTVFAKYTTVGKSTLIMGDSIGNVWYKGKYTDSTLLKSDGGNPISSNFELPPLLISDISTTKKVHNLFAYAERGQGLKLYARAIDKNDRILTPYKPVGSLDKFVNTFQVDMKKGALLQISGSEYSVNPYWSFYGMELDIAKDGDILKTK